MEPRRDEREHLFDKPENVRRLLLFLYSVCAGLLLLDFVDAVLKRLGVVDLRHGETWWEGLPGFYAFYGFLACVALVLIAKNMRRVLMRDEDYYDR
jgi:hypothetical protein